MDLSIHIDGGARNNPGPAAAGVVMCDLHTGKPVHEAGYYLGKMTNNVAEYRALICALELAGQLGAGQVHIHSDSELMVRQITGQYRVKSADLKPLHEQAEQRLLKLGAWQIRHVKRAQNARADELVNLALDAGRHVIVIAAPGTNVPALPSDAAPAAASSNAPSANPARTARGAKGEPSGPRWHVQIMKKPGPRCPVPARAGQRLVFGPDAPAGVCIYAAQAVFDEDITLWPDADRRQAQTHCQRCGVAIEIEMNGGA